MIIRRNNEGFTLVELIIVISILGVLTVAVILIVNPSELTKKTRDAIRLNDLNILNSSLDMVSIDNTNNSFGNANTIYISLPDSDSSCSNISLPALPLGWSYNCVSTSTLRNIDGTGWIPVNFSTLSLGSPLSVLPIDPLNNLSSGRYYTYTPGGSWVITSVFESQKYQPQMVSDNGFTDGRFEIGTDLALIESTPFGGAFVANDITSLVLNPNQSFSIDLRDYFGAPNGGDIIFNLDSKGQNWISLSNGVVSGIAPANIGPGGEEFNFDITASSASQEKIKILNTSVTGNDVGDAEGL